MKNLISTFNQLQLLEQKVTLAFLLKYNNDEIVAHKRYFLTASEYAVFISAMKHGSYRRFQYVTNTLSAKMIDPDAPKEQQEKLFHRFRYLKERQRLEQGEVGLVVEFNPTFAQFCNSIKSIFSLKHMLSFIQFNSLYGLRIALMFFLEAQLNSDKIESLKQEVKLEIPMEKFRKYTGTESIYTRLPDLKSRIINKGLSSFKDPKFTQQCGFKITLQPKLTLNQVPLKLTPIN